MPHFAPGPFKPGFHLDFSLPFVAPVGFSYQQKTRTSNAMFKWKHLQKTKTSNKKSKRTTKGICRFWFLR